jgi:hypothetical protein
VLVHQNFRIHIIPCRRHSPPGITRKVSSLRHESWNDAMKGTIEPLAAGLLSSVTKFWTLEQSFS